MFTAAIMNIVLLLCEFKSQGLIKLTSTYNNSLCKIYKKKRARKKPCGIGHEIEHEKSIQSDKF